jgi:hypothetical protein
MHQRDYLSRCPGSSLFEDLQPVPLQLGQLRTEHAVQDPGVHVPRCHLGLDFDLIPSHNPHNLRQPYDANPSHQLDCLPLLHGSNVSGPFLSQPSLCLNVAGLLQ